MVSRLKVSIIIAGIALVLAVGFTAPGRALAQQNGGAFVPTFNYLRTGIDNYFNGLQTNGAYFQTYTVVLSNAQFIALNATPIAVIPICTASAYAACIPANYVAVPIYGVASFNEFATYGGGSDLRLFYTSRNGGNAGSGAITFAGMFDTAASNNEDFTGVVAGPEPGKTAKAVVVQANTSAAITGGDGRNTVTIQVQAMVYPTGTLN